MKAEEIKEKIKALDKQLAGYKETEKIIADLKKEKKKLKDKLDNQTLTFEQKFSKWLNKQSGEHEGFIPGEYNGYPIFNEFRLLDCFRNENRYETIYIKEEEPYTWLWSFILGEMTLEEMNEQIGGSRNPTEFTKEEVYSIAKEFMDNNLLSFKYDW